MTDVLAKGFLIEELLRHYFIKGGYFTVRSVPFMYDGFDVTDIDLWLYERPSSVSRHRIIVDTKNRSTPKAIERIFWTKGLQEVVGAEQAIVATTDKRPAVTAFGRQHGVVILDGNFLSRLRKSLEAFDARLTEEEFRALLGSYNPSKRGGDWKHRLRAAKHHFAGDLGYNAINTWLAEARFFAEQVHLVPTHREIALRMFYLLSAFVAIAFDFATRELTFWDTATKQAAISDGLKYGSEGAAGTRRLIDLATGLIEQYAPEQRAIAARIRARLGKELDSIPTRILAEHFAKPPVAQDLFSVAKELEAAAYGRAFVAPNTLSSTAKGILGVMLDFAELDRKLVLQGNGAPNANPQTSPQTSVHEASPAHAREAGQSSLPGLKG